MAEKVDLLVSLSDEHEADAVTSDLRDAGLEIERAMPEIGTITGKAAPEKIAGIGAVKGVAAVEQAGTFEIAPPESDVQ
jgi:hypothetical protein